MAVKSILLCASTIIAFMPYVFAEQAEPNRLLRVLYDSSDLVVEATLTETCGGGMSSGPIPTDSAQLYVLSCTLQVKVNRVLKGDYNPENPIRIGVTVPLSDKGPDEMYLEKDMRYIFFLEDRTKREPDSHHEAGGELIRYRTFDWWLSRLPASAALTLKLENWAKEKISR